MKFEEKILRLLSQYDYDVRISGDGRWCDQKCTPDVVSIVSDSIINYLELEGEDSKFTATDIWNAEYTENNVVAIFNKPETNEPRSKNEYDKFFSQPLKLLSYSGILIEDQLGRSNVYSVNNLELLDGIGSSVRKSYIFLVKYIREVLNDSGLSPEFEHFFTEQTPESYANLKLSFANFTRKYTNIKGKFEPNRIFSKVINPLACERGLRGTRRGRISKYSINYSDLMYNRLNIRDEVSNKPKNITRQEWLEENKNPAITDAVIEYQAQRAQGTVRRFNQRYFSRASELKDEYSKGLATQMHHIFPKSIYKELSMYVENIIALTPNQHYLKAHPNNDTSRIDPYYQEACLKAKLGTIRLAEKNDIDSIYEFDNFVHVINVGLDNEYLVEENDYTTVVDIIEEHYADY